METFLSVCVGIGLAAACGFRIFVPLLVVSVAALSGHMPLAKGFEWIGTYPAAICFGVATILEVAAYYVPWIDNLLDTIASPAAVVAGIVVSASMMGDLDPWLRWTLAAIAGGSVAGAVQSGTVLTRAASTGTTGGLANPIVATGELVLSGVTSVLAMVLPVLALLLILGFAVFITRKTWKKLRPA